MTPAARNASIRAEIDELLREDELDSDTWRRLRQLYPVESWDWRSLGRWFLLFGVLSFAGGAFFFLRDIFHFTFEKLAVLLTVLTLALFAAGQWLRRRKWQMVAESAELLGALALIGLSFTLGIIFSTGSGDWPTLLLIDFVILLPVTYVLCNRLLLVLVAVLFFVWFGGRTGYVSGWGAYWFGMNYPLRFLAVSVPIVGMGVLHMIGEAGPLARYRGFAKIWISVGLFFGEMALWLMSIFGNFDLEDSWSYHAPASVLVLFNLLWAALNLGLIAAGARFAFRMLTGYGATFLIIQGYTLFFTHIGNKMHPFLSAFIAGAAALVLAFVLERRIRTRPGEDASTEQTSPDRPDNSG